MKKLLIGIFAFFVGFVSFSSASIVDDLTMGYCNVSSTTSNLDRVLFSTCFDGCKFTGTFVRGPGTSQCFNYLFFYTGDNSGSLYNLRDEGLMSNSNAFLFFPENYDITFINIQPSATTCSFSFYRCHDLNSVIGSSTPSDITVYYNNGQTTNIACNGDNIITIDGLSTMSSISTFTPYFNINYVDQDNQILTESYSKDILYLSGAKFRRTYTGDNEWILNYYSFGLGSGFIVDYSGLVVSGDIVSDNLSGNIFKNFIDTGFEVLFSNIPSYIQYVVLIAILLLILRIFRRKKRI